MWGWNSSAKGSGSGEEPQKQKPSQRPKADGDLHQQKLNLHLNPQQEPQDLHLNLQQKPQDHGHLNLHLGHQGMPQNHLNRRLWRSMLVSAGVQMCCRASFRGLMSIALVARLLLAKSRVFLGHGMAPVGLCEFGTQYNIPLVSRSGAVQLAWTSQGHEDGSSPTSFDASAHLTSEPLTLCGVWPVPPPTGSS